MTPIEEAADSPRADESTRTARSTRAPLVIAADLQQREEALLTAAFHGLTDLVVVCGLDGLVDMTNRAIDEVVVPARAGAPARSAFEGGGQEVDGTLVASCEALLARALSGESVHDVELTTEAKPRGRRRLLASGQRLFGADGLVIGASVVLRDITEQRADAAPVGIEALHDWLTGLPNRALFVDRLRRSLERARRHNWKVAVLALNLDRFADIANRLGDDSGGKLLSEVARRLQVSLRPYDSVSRPLDTVARLGGDQFLLLCEHMTDARAALRVVERIDAALRVPMTIAGEVLSITAGIGFTLAREPAPEPETLILEAETALHHAKQRGAGRHEAFAREMRARLHVGIEREVALQQALVRGEFRIAYQPKVSLTTNRTTGVEALLRWDHPDRGVLAPLEFIPLAEETGLIVPIGCWVLEQVCRDAQRWSKSLPGSRPLLVAVNVSPRQFESGLAAMFGTIIANSGIDPATLFLEVTEGMVMKDAELAITTLSELKSLGLRISIDDFGTGFSSLSYLRRFPVDELKIDKSFVDGLGHDPQDTAIVAAVMAMAHALSLSVVAEGVETVEQAALLRTLGCDEAQGYYFARPCPARDIDEILVRSAMTMTRPTQPSATTEAQSGRPETVLVVDDAVSVRQLARASLAAVGFEVHEAGSGEEAVRLAEQLRPDCVVLDVNLPGISGLDVCQILRADPANKHTTIVMLTVEAEAAEKVEAFSRNADDYMVKPFSPRDLVSRVTAAMQRRHSSMFARAQR